MHHLGLNLKRKYHYAMKKLCSQKFDDTSIDTAGPVSILWHVSRSGPHLIWKQEHSLKCLTPMFNLAAEEHNCSPDIKRRNPRNRASHLRNMEISAKYDTYLCQPYVRTLFPLWINTLAFWKHRQAFSLAIIHFNILFSGKCNSSSVHLWEWGGGRRGRGRERCMYELPP